MEGDDGSSPNILASQILQRLGDIRAHLLSLAQTLDLDNAFGILAKSMIKYKRIMYAYFNQTRILQL